MLCSFLTWQFPEFPLLANHTRTNSNPLGGWGCAKQPCRRGGATQSLPLLLSESVFRFQLLILTHTLGFCSLPL